MQYFSIFQDKLHSFSIQNHLIIWQLSIDHNIDVQSVFSWAPKLARKCESKHWYACGADGRSAVGVRSRDYQIFWDG